MACPIKITMGMVNKREPESEERELTLVKRTGCLQSIVQCVSLYYRY